MAPTGAAPFLWREWGISERGVRGLRTSVISSSPEEANWDAAKVSMSSFEHNLAKADAALSLADERLRQAATPGIA
jgi:hypothetical protein